MYTHQYPCKVLDNYDGDTIKLALDRGFYEVKYVSARLHGVDTPEISRVRAAGEHVDLFKAAGRYARDRVRSLLDEADQLVFVSLKNPGKFGRPIGDVLMGADHVSLVAYLLDNNLGIPYDGGNRTSQAFIDAHLANILELVDRGLTEDYGL